MIDVTARRKAREIALQVMFQREFVKDVEIQTSLEYFREVVTATPEAWDYAEFLLTGVVKQITEIDAAISDKSQNWKLSRMSAVDLSILRVAAFEILFAEADVPPKAVINEAIEVAKRYGSTESSAFINGILDEIFRQKSK
jgi:transcription antitermination protein NusB